MALWIVLGLLAFAAFLAIRAPFRALVAAVFFAPWAGFDVDVGLRVTAYLIFLAPLVGVFLVSATQGRRAREALASLGLFWLVVVYAVLWSLLQIPFLPEAVVAGGALRSPELRAVVQIVMFFIMIAPLFLVPWLVLNLDQVRYLVGTYLVSVVVLASLGWVQLVMWAATGSDPMPVGFVDNLLGGAAGQRSGQFVFGGDLVYRMSSFGGEPKGLGVGLAVGLLLLQAGVRPRWRFANALWPFLFVSMLATFSTMAILAWFGASLVQLAFRGRGNQAGRESVFSLNRRFLYLGLTLSVLVPGTFIAFPESRFVQLIEHRTIDRVIGESNIPGYSPGFLEDFNEAVIGFLRASPAYSLTGVGLGNAHLYADPFLPDYAVRYAGGTTFVAKSFLLRWISEIGVISLAVFLIWWARMVGRTTRMTAYRPDTIALGGIVQRAGWSLLAFWLVSGYVTSQFFLLTGIVLAVGQVLRVNKELELYRLGTHWSGA
jgi:hypothetical protein